MAALVETKIVLCDLTPGKRCPDFDEDCEGINHFACFSGFGELPMADGYCPYLAGMQP